MTKEDPLFSRYGRAFAAGEVLFREGETGSQMYVIQSGRVAISRRVGDDDRTFATLGAGDFFGEMALLAARPRSATATVVEPARCVVLDVKTFETMLRNNTEIAVRMIRKLADRLEQADAQITVLLQGDARTRLVRCLVERATSDARPVDGGLLVPLDRAELSVRLCIGADELEAELARLARARLAVAGEGGVVIPDVGELREYRDYLDKRAKFGDL